MTEESPPANPPVIASAPTRRVLPVAKEPPVPVDRSRLAKPRLMPVAEISQPVDKSDE